MSRVSQKTGLSPSITRGSNGIDLGKNSGVDIGRKSEPSITSGGIGITQEIISVGGARLSGGINVEISPLTLGINVNPLENTISIANSAELPGGFLGVSGGVTINTNTGEVTGGSIGGEVGGFGINISNSQKGGVGIEITLQIPGTPIEFSLGLVFPPGQEPKTPSPSPAPAPAPTPSPGSAPPEPGIPPEPTYPKGTKAFCKLVVTKKSKFYSLTGGAGVSNYFFGDNNETKTTVTATYDGLGILTGSVTYKEFRSHYNTGEPDPGTYNWEYDPPTQTYIIPVDPNPNRITPNFALDLEIRHLGGEAYELKGKEEKIYTWLRSQNKTTNETFTRADYGGGAGFWDLYRTISFVRYSIVLNRCSPPPLPSLPFPNPPPRRRNKMDVCCQENLKLLRAIYTKLGLARFPGQLPNTIIQEVAEEGEEPAEPAQVPIPDLVTLLSWQFERDDERWGQWVVQINVKDSNVTQEGDQGKQIKFPNLAESIAEIEGQILSLSANVDALVAITTKNLVESGLGRQESIKSYLAAKSIIKYMAFKTTEIDVDIPATFTPEAQTIHELVNESTIHFKGIDYTEKETLRDILLDLLQGVAIIRAVHWQRIDTKKDTKTQLLEFLQSTAGLANSIKNPTKPDGTAKPKPTQDFEDFIDTVEDGFRSTTGITDGQNPYGKTPDRRPRIRQIGDNISQAGKS